MRALLCKAHGLPETLRVEELPSPVPGPGQVLIDVKAAGVNFPDALIIQNKYQLQSRRCPLRRVRNWPASSAQWARG